jgi:chemotaxis protein histidine kinase CheA
MDDLDKLLLQTFREEVAELFDTLAQNVDAFASNTGQTLNELITGSKRIAHNIKGAAATVGMRIVEDMAHALEDCLRLISDVDQQVPESLVDLIQECITIMMQLVEGQELDDEALEFMERLTKFDLDSDTIAEQGEGPEKGPSPETNERSQEQEGDDGLDVSGSEDDSVAMRSVRVDLARLDSLMGFTGELLITQARLAERSDRLEEFMHSLVDAVGDQDVPRKEIKRRLSKQLDGLIQQDHREFLDYSFLVNEIGLAMKRVRMLPLKSVAPSLRRIVRDSAKDLKKNVKLFLEVGDVEIDKHVLDNLLDPIRHLLRNAVDHGIESAEERVAAAKPKSGTILIRATMQGAMVRLEFSDDGGGIDYEKVGRLAVEKGLISQEQLEGLDSKEIANLVFSPGFSMADQVSRISGRGIGLDVVQRQVEELNGSVEIADKPTLGGTTFYLTLPVSLLLTKGLLVYGGNTVYAFPVEYVLKIVRIGHEQLKLADGTDAMLLDGREPVRVQRLAHLMGESVVRRSDKLNIVVVAHAGYQLGIIVDKVIGEEEFVTKRLPWNLSHVNGVNGALILGDGSLALSVDIPYFVSSFSKEKTPLEKVEVTEVGSRKLRILVVDDSMTHRVFNKNILTAAGYDVVLEIDGEEAWKVLQEQDIDLVVSDIQMPKLDGFGLTRRIRASSKLKDLPVILVSRLATSEDIARGAEVGADKYLIKGKFEQKKLVEAVKLLI